MKRSVWFGVDDGETVDHPALPHAGPTTFQFQRRWIVDLVGQLSPARVKVPDYGWRVLCLPFRTRMANAETITWGPFSYTRARPWLVGPARTLHPEIFENRKDLIAYGAATTRTFTGTVISNL